MTFFHVGSIGLTPKEYEERIQQILGKYGCFVQDFHKYKNQTDSSVMGTILAQTIATAFIESICNDVVNAFRGLELSLFSPPAHIIDPYLLAHHKFADIINGWFESMALHIAQYGDSWYGRKEDVERAIVLLSRDEEKRKLQYYQLRVPFDIPINRLIQQLKMVKRDTGTTFVLMLHCSMMSSTTLVFTI